MMTILNAVIFLGSFAVAVGVIASSIVPQWRRIAHLAMGNLERPVVMITTPAHAERRIAVRRWAAMPVPAPVAPLRATA
ncbi:hypothetical protein [Sphingomonas sp.]|jgi:hypothetical protein|uniref:hypothetical protein n=1 Tax=Sphingomonas sp. TaxID=28214 RepID=UPI002EDA420F